MTSFSQSREWNPASIEPPTEEERARFALYETNGEWPSDEEVAEAISDSLPPTNLGLSAYKSGDPAAFSVGLSTRFGETGIDRLGEKILRQFPALQGVWDVRLDLSAQVRERIHEERIFYGKEGAALELAAERAVHNAMGDLLLEVYTRILTADS